MAILNVNPTRMELSRLKKRLTTATRGHKLLKDKQDELVRQFIQLVKKNQELRKKMETALQAGMEEYVLASSSIPDVVLQEAFMIPLNKVTLDVQSRTIMNMDVPVLNPVYEEESSDDDFSYGFVSTTSELDLSLSHLDQMLPVMLQLAEIEKTCQLMANEIERTAQMTPYECTLLAGVPNAPSAYDPAQNPGLARQRQKKVVEQMVERGCLSAAQAREALTPG